MNVFISFAILISVVITSDAKDGPILTLHSGKIKGKFVENKDFNSSYYAFQGVPYAKPPIGKLRFMVAQDVEPWEGVKETTEDGPFCIQKDCGSEDCLFLNVFTPKLPTNDDFKPMPVLVKLFGSAYKINGPKTQVFGPEFIVNKGVIFVMIGHRLNIFGFLSTGDEVVPGNAALNDINFGLRWVQRNIVSFGGDPNQVTLIGHSSGAIMLSMFVISKLFKGLFQKAIIQSGTLLSSGFTSESTRTKAVERIKAKFGIITNSSEEFVSYLQTLDARTLMQETDDLGWADNVDEPVLGPVVEIDHSGAMLTNGALYSTINNDFNRVPIMMGYVDLEGIIYVPCYQFCPATPLFNCQTRLHNVTKDFGVSSYVHHQVAPNAFLPNFLSIKNDPSLRKEIQTKIIEHYFHNGTLQNRTEFIKYLSSKAQLSTRLFSDIMRHKHDVYVYKFTYKGDNTTGLLGVTHSEELQYLYNSGNQLTARDKPISEKFTTLITNFVKTGNPTPHKDTLLQNIIWPKLEPSGENVVLNFDGDLKLEKSPEKEEYDFWKNLILRYSKFGEELKSLIL